MASLEFCTVTSNGIGAIDVDYVDAGTDPDENQVYAFVDFVPRLPKGTVLWCAGLDTPRGIQLDTVRGRFDIDGKLRTIVGHQVNEKQVVTVTGSPTSIVLHLSGQDTASIAMSANSAAASLVQTRLEALSNVGAGNVFVTGINPWVCFFRGALAGTNLAQMTGTPTGGTAPVVDVDTEDDGNEADGVKLVASTTVISDAIADLNVDGLTELIYDVFLTVPYSDRKLNPFAFVAPTSATSFDLTAVTKIPPKLPSRGPGAR
jgi:hypothetical protein